MMNQKEHQGCHNMVIFCMIDPQNGMVIQRISDDSGGVSAHGGYVFANVNHAGKPTKAQPYVVMAIYGVSLGGEPWLTT